MGKPTSFRQNTIKGTTRGETLVGGAGADRLVGGGGNDTLIAAWDDIANTPSGYLIYNGGTGIDTLDFSRLDRGAAADLHNGYIYRQQTPSNHGELYDPQLSDRLSGAVSGIENVVGTRFDDYLIGSSGNNYIHGGDGNDRLSSGMGTDVLIGGRGDDAIFLGMQSGTMTGDDDSDALAVGNDIFYASGSMAGVYSVNRITDFDLRDDVNDAQFDKLYLNQIYGLTWAEEGGVLVAYQTMQNGGDPVGKIIFEGLTGEDIASIALYSVDFYTGTVTPISPEWGG